jgi:feruloyl-CoA synthase
MSLVEEADGLIEGRRPGVAERLGLGPEPCLAKNPRLVYGRMTGWGQSGPLAQTAAHDLNYIAITGALEAIGRKGQPPTPPLTLVGDLGGGALYLALGMLAAMLEARKSGQGQVVDAAVSEGAAHLMTNFHGLHAAGMISMERGANYSDSGAPLLRRLRMRGRPIYLDRPDRRQVLQTAMCRVDARPHRRLSAASERRFGDAGSTHHPEVTMRAPIRPVRLGPDEGVAESRPDGSVILRVKEPLGAYPRILTDRLVDWAHARPDQIFLRMRTPTRGLVALSYRETLDRVVRIATSLLRRDISFEHPIAILSENNIEHALLVLAALHIGVPYAPISPSYALLAKDYAKLRHVVRLLAPGLVVAASGARYGAAIANVIEDAVEAVWIEDPLERRLSTSFAHLLGDRDDGAVAAAHARLNARSPAKILFTSGTTGMPKGVVFSHGMLVSQRQQVVQTFAFLQDQAPVMVDWLPWHHTFGGTNNFGIALYSGGELTIDTGRPTPEGIAPTVANLREIAPTLYFNTPSGFAALLPFFREDSGLREKFFSRLQLIYYGGATLPEHVWSALDDLALQTIGRRVMITSGVGCTEFGPTPMSANWDPDHQPLVGLPAPGVEAKIAPVGEKWELRLRGPCAMSGYLKAPELTAAAFDEEGFYRTGDAVRFIDPLHPEKGLRFDGRLAENFKISTGTWVDSSSLRSRLIAGFAPLLRDAVIAGANRDFVTALVFPDIEACRRLAALPAAATVDEIVAAKAVRRALQERLAALARSATGSSNRIVRIAVQTEPALLDTGELTDKGSVSAKMVLERRAGVLESLYRESIEDSPDILDARHEFPAD